MKAVFQISVSEQIGKLLNTREAATLLLDVVRESKCSVIELDFTSVEFMSRSFADQFHKDKIEFQNKLNVSIDIVNTNEEIINILQTVSRTQVKSIREFAEVQIFKFSNTQLISDYLLSI
jgi:anti-anti-sigma regulatory factor